MPLYEYQCDACGIKMEKIRKFSDPPLEICEACGGRLQKLFSSPAIQFKGSGWYITDYAKKTAVEGTSGSTTSEGGKAADSPGKDSAGKDSATKSDTSGGGTSGDKTTGSSSKP